VSYLRRRRAAAARSVTRSPDDPAAAQEWIGSFLRIRRGPESLITPGSANLVSADVSAAEPETLFTPRPLRRRARTRR